jgi:septal ring factor EnvC (AmiA/AmiB activator)
LIQLLTVNTCGSLTSPFELFADLEARVEQLKASKVDMKNLFYREKDAREVLEYEYKQLAHECNTHMELQIASDRDIVNCYKSLQKLGEDCEKLQGQLKELEEAALPIARLLVPHPGGRRLLRWLTG